VQGKSTRHEGFRKRQEVNLKEKKKKKKKIKRKRGGMGGPDEKKGLEEM